MPLQISADQLTLGEGAHYAHHITTCTLPLDFQTFLQPCSNFIFHTILQEEYKHLQASSVNSSGGNSNSSASASTGPNNSSQHSGLPVHSPHTGNGMVPTSEAEIIHEAKMLREHKDRLNSRMKLLEVHNSQLEMQLGKLRQLLNAPGGSCSTSSSENNSAGVS